MDEHGRTAPFAFFSQAELEDIARAIEAASGEGAFGNTELARKLAGEFKRRELRIPQAYGHGDYDPDDWLDWLQ
jgi:hypothetical protein